mmetsp:Transcript_11322/g.28558  ORF Transcript_11322/g.28558 Transcript_11322/m.28558 type:complete len:279 (-) Transcript_11322:8-844(-)
MTMNSSTPTQGSAEKGAGPTAVRDLLDAFLQGHPPEHHTQVLQDISRVCQDLLAKKQAEEREKTEEAEERQSTQVRGYMDGCFDITHSGHFNAIRQASSLADILVVGVHSDDEIMKNKGPTVMTEEERYELVRACKWVDELVEDVPYSPTVQLLANLNCDFVVHGDDLPRNADGTGTFDEAIQAGKMKIVKRTEGLSTTSIVGRLMDLASGTGSTDGVDGADGAGAGMPENHTSPSSQFLPTVHRLVEFSKLSCGTPSVQPVQEHHSVVYVDGVFDIF